MAEPLRPSGPPPEYPDLNYGSIAKELLNSFEHVVQSEARLARAEVSEIVNDVKKEVSRAAIFGGLAVAGFLPILSFLVIGLGRLLNGNYWLSSLIVGVVMIGIGVGFTLGSVRRIRHHDYSMPHLRDSLQDQRVTIERKIDQVSHDIQDLRRRRSA